MIFIFFAFLILYPFLYLPKFGLQAEMFAESATNYFHTAHNLRFLDGLKVTDYGYLPLLPRLLADLVEAVAVPLRYVPMAYDLIATLIIALSVFSFVGSWGERIVKSKNLRMIFALFIFMLPDFELKTFVNFTYWLFIPIFLLSLRAWFEPKSFSRLGWLAFVGLGTLAILSKPLFFVMVPVLGLVALRLLYLSMQSPAESPAENPSDPWELRWRAFSLLSLPLGVALQLWTASSVWANTTQALSPTTSPTLKLDSLFYGAFYIPLALIEKIFGHIIVHNSSRIFLLVLGAFIFWRFFKKMWKGGLARDKKEFLVIFALSSLVIYFNAVISLSSYPNYLELISTFKIRPVLTLLGFRHWFFANLAAYFVVLKMYDLLPRWYSASRIFFFILLMFAGEHFSLPLRTIDESAYESGNSDWAGGLRFYGSTLGASQSFCLPINPMMWFYTSHCEVLGDREFFRDFFQREVKTWSQAKSQYSFAISSPNLNSFHWIGIAGEKSIREEQISSFKINGQEQPIQLVTTGTAVTYLSLFKTSNVRSVEITFKQPIALALKPGEQAAFVFATTTDSIF